jgi:phosphoglycerol transferase MdoB-like AlkP superfamily enzyme
MAFFLLSFYRLLFLLFNYNAFSTANFPEIAFAFFIGLKFDAVFLAYSLLPFILIHLTPSTLLFFPKVQSVTKIYFITVVLLGLLLNTVDIEFFKYTKKRTGIELFLLLSDPANPIFSYVINFWYHLVFLSACTYILYKYYLKTPLKPFFNPAKYWLNWLVFILAIPVIFISMRGGLGLKPLKSSDVSKWVTPGLEPLALSTPFQLISSIDAKIESYPFSLSNKDLPDMDSYYRSFPPVFDSVSNKNIVLIVLESFGRDYVDFLNGTDPSLPNFTPFLNKLASRSLIFPHCFANGTRSADALPAIFAGIPNLLEQQFLYSQFQANTVRGVHYYLSQVGYDCSFYHGAANGTMGFESFLKKSGPIQYNGINQYPTKKLHHDGKWGIYDHHYLSYVANELSEKKQPYFASIFTLSSHHPYKIPANFEKVLPQGPLDIHKSIAYTDSALSLFFSAMEKQPQHANTLYYIIADHTSHSHREYFYTPHGRMEITCMLYDPSGQIKPSVSNKIVQQIDVMPTILNLVSYPDTFFSLGESMLVQNENSKAMFRLDNHFYLVKHEQVLQLSNNDSAQIWPFTKSHYGLNTDTLKTKKLLKHQYETTLKQWLKVFWESLTVLLSNRYNHKFAGHLGLVENQQASQF